MEKEFIPYEQALALKELGFNEPCFGYWRNEPQFKNPLTMCKYTTVDNSNDNDNFPNFHCLAPTFLQAFRWFRDNGNVSEIFSQLLPSNKYKWGFKIQRVEGITDGFFTYEEAELECLKKLIEIVKNG